MQADELVGGSKKHSACDECRKRKLKCSGEPFGCTRCIKQGLPCVYSVQKQMGRPRKTQPATSTGVSTPTSLRHDSSASSTSTYVHVDDRLPDLSMGQYISAEAWAMFLRNYMPPPDPPAVPRVPSQVDIAQHHPHVSNYQQPIVPQDPNLYQSNIWPEYPSYSYPTMAENYSMPTPSSDGGYSPAVQTSSNGPGPIPTCACLPNMYLTLSSLSSLQSFPITPNTIETLHTAAHTTHSVVYCRVCPTNFQAGTQNMMMLGSVLSTLVDTWFRILRTPAYDLWHGFYASADIATKDGMPKREWDQQEEPYWQLWGRQTVYKNVFGTTYGQNFSSRQLGLDTNRGSEKIELTLATLVDALERRQKMWHDQIPQTDEFVTKQSFGPAVDAMRALVNGETERHQAQGHIGPGSQHHQHLCISIVQNVKKVMKSIAYLMGVPQVIDI